jgi:hypothetical protein
MGIEVPAFDPVRAAGHLSRGPYRGVSQRVLSRSLYESVALKVRTGILPATFLEAGPACGFPYLG